MSEEQENRNRPSAERQRVMIHGLEVWSTVGVPDAERENSQRLLIDVEVVPDRSFRVLDDKIEQAVDYHALSLRIKEVAENGERRLIETLAADLVDAVMEDNKVVEVTLKIRKFILPDTEYVAVERTQTRLPPATDGESNG
jgi:dihydroneopterin aldolase